MRLFRSPVVQFLVVALLAVVGILVATGVLAKRAASDEAIQEARRTTRALARSVVEPDIPAGLVENRPGALDRFDRRVVKRLVGVRQVRAVNIWSSDGRVIYSSQTGLIGQRLGLTGDQSRVLAEGGSGSELVDSAPGVSLEESEPGMVRTYTRVKTQPGEAVLFEAYYSLNRIDTRQQEIFSSFRWITIGPLVLLTLLATPMLWVLTRRLTRIAGERERLLQRAIEASDNERRRIARDLHDGVVQDLAGTAYSLSALARDPQTPPERQTALLRATRSLRESLTSLRSLLAEIHPPDLHPGSLPAALGDLVAPAEAAGIAASVSVTGVDGSDDSRVALVWRVAQEAVRNALRHSQASTLAVTVRGADGRLSLEVVDDGIGFEPGSVQEAERFGLRGLRSLVTDADGTLEVRSSPREGTTVRLEVAAR